MFVKYSQRNTSDVGKKKRKNLKKAEKNAGYIARDVVSHQCLGAAGPSTSPCCPTWLPTRRDCRELVRAWSPGGAPDRAKCCQLADHICSKPAQV